MQYKTIILELLQQRPQLYDQLRKDRFLLWTLELHARELKTSHEDWKKILHRWRPQSDPSQIASEALELALKQLEVLLTVSPRDDREEPSLDAAMAFIQTHTPRD